VPIEQLTSNRLTDLTLILRTYLVVSNVIVLFDFIEQMNEKGEPLERALPDAGIERIRPGVQLEGSSNIFGGARRVLSHLSFLSSVPRPDRVFVVQVLDNLVRGLPAFAGRMSEAATAGAILNVQNHVVARTGSNAHWNGVQLQCAARFPRYDMIGTGGVSAHAEPAHEFSLSVV
jgi:hypothetical protein